MKASVCIVGVLLAGIVGSAVGAEDPGLPPRDCVELMRGARIAEMRGDLNDALARYRDAVDRFPDELSPLVELWRFHRSHPLAEDQAAGLRARLTARLGNPELPLHAGTLAYLVDVPGLEAGEQRLILDAVLVRLEQHPKNVEFLGAAATLQLRLEEWAAARDSFGRLLEVKPSMSVRWACIQLDRELENWSSAVELLRPLAGEEADLFTRMSYIEALGKTGRYEELTQRLDSLLASSAPEGGPGSLLMSELLRGIAWDLRDHGLDDEARTIFKRLLGLDAKNAEARAALLYLYSSQAEQSEHQAALEQQWAAEDDPTTLLDRGTKLLATGDAEGAIELLRRGTAGLPGEEIGWLNLGLAAVRLETWAEADTALARAIELNPSRALSHLNRGTALYRLERCSEAVPVLERTLELQPDAFQAHYYLWACYKALGQTAEAERALASYNAAQGG